MLEIKLLSGYQAIRLSGYQAIRGGSINQIVFHFIHHKVHKSMAGTEEDDWYYTTRSDL